MILPAVAMPPGHCSGVRSTLGQHTSYPAQPVLDFGAHSWLEGKHGMERPHGLHPFCQATARRVLGWQGGLVSFLYGDQRHLKKAYRQGLQSLKDHQYQTAIRLLEKASQTTSRFGKETLGYADVLFLLGAAYLNNQQAEPAKERLLQALEIYSQQDPDVKTAKTGLLKSVLLLWSAKEAQARHPEEAPRKDERL